MATCRWITHGDTTLLLCPPGTGKAYLAVALDPGSQSAELLGPVRYRSNLVAMLVKAHDEGLFDEQLT